LLSKKKIFKVKNKIYYSKNFFLKKINQKNCNKNYLDWMNNKKINQYLESRFKKYTLNDIKNFVNISNKDYSTILFGIFHNQNNEHIGNIKIAINFFHEYATLGYIIGNRHFQGMNIGSESIKLCTSICFKFLKLRFCLASAYHKNIPSLKVLKKNNFKQVSRIKNMYKLKNNIYVDDVTFMLKNKFYKN
jgi:ribosomal-protein-alanine N-acetyltransferase